jgi:hypothetical protein
MFLNLFRNIELNDKALQELGFDAVARMPLVYEEEKSE